MTFDPVWETIHNARPWGTDPEQIFSRFLSGYYSKDKLFLDIGCGSGAATLAIAKLGYKVIAVDCSESAIKRLNLLLEENGLNHLVSPLVSDIMALNLTPGSIDCITDISCLSQVSLEEASKFVGMAKAWLRPSGILFSRLACEPYDEALLNCWGTNPDDGSPVKLWPYGTRMTTEEMLPVMFDGYVSSYDKIMGTHKNGMIATHFYVVARKISGL